jgi:hypothetical protein
MESVPITTRIMLMSTTKKTDLHNIAEILVKVVLNTFNQTDFQPEKPTEIDIVLLSYFIIEYTVVNRAA